MNPLFDELSDKINMLEKTVSDILEKEGQHIDITKNVEYNKTLADLQKKVDEIYNTEFGQDSVYAFLNDVLNKTSILLNEAMNTNDIELRKKDLNAVYISINLFKSLNEYMEIHLEADIDKLVQKEIRQENMEI